MSTRKTTGPAHACLDLIARAHDDSPLVAAANVRVGDLVLFGGQWLTITNLSASFIARRVTWTLAGGRQVGLNRDLRLTVLQHAKAA